MNIVKQLMRRLACDPIAQTGVLALVASQPWFENGQPIVAGAHIIGGAVAILLPDSSKEPKE